MIPVFAMLYHRGSEWLGSDILADEHGLPTPPAAMMRNLRRILTLAGLLWGLGGSFGHAELTAVGFAKREITPPVPVRLSGYSDRSEAFDRVRDPLFVRVMVIGEGEKTCVAISIESLAVTGDQTAKIAKRLSDDFKVDRARIVVASTHSHAAPHPSGAIGNLYRQPLSEAEQRDLAVYTSQIHVAAIDCVGEAMAKRQPARLYVGESKADFAVNRRVLTDGLWSGFGVAPDGPTDRRVKVMLARDGDGQVLGAMFQYACHCTTLGPDFNELTGDWAGLAAGELETEMPQAIFVPIIGCGGDANPEPRGDYEYAVAHGQEISNAIRDVLSAKDLQSLNGPPSAKFGYAGLSAELPSRDELSEIVDNDSEPPVRRNWASSMLATWDAKGRLPESYPAPIHTWTFGDALVCVFLGGEVVVDYQIRLESELRASLPVTEVWVAAYCDDCFAYVASERMRAEGGYEVDASMLYYLQPGRWQSGTEDLVVRRVHEIQRSDAVDSRPLSPQNSLNSIQVPDGFDVTLVAFEPLVQDPINLAFDADGSVWVVEMGDYPLGNASGGRVKHLRDADGDGVLDTASVFIDSLNYPTSVMPWRDGVIVIAAPEVILFRDTDGDDIADDRETLLAGIGESNPQHRASGFDYGLDGWLYLGAGEGTREIVSHRTGKAIDVNHGDVRWNPDTGELEKLSGQTQFVRSRDRFGRWFGNSNSLPLFHYRINEAAIAERNRQVQASRLVLQPGVAPPVYPSSRTVDRFNDLFAKDRFTSACSSIIVRGQGLGIAMQDAALVCEPVHNLVARFQLESDHESVSGKRFAEDESAKRDFVTSTDTWFRPVRATEAPDGSIWIVDMLRRVIEHPEWIPDAWQQQMDVRAGEDAGRIYRVSVKRDVTRMPLLKTASEAVLVETLAGSNAVRRDLAMQQILWRGNQAIQESLRDRMHASPAAEIRLQLFGTLLAGGWHRDDDWAFMLDDPEPLAAAWVLNAAGRQMAKPNPTLGAEQIVESIRKRLDQRVSEPQTSELEAYCFQSLLTLVDLELAESDQGKFVAVTGQLLERYGDSQWAIEALSLAQPRQAEWVLPMLLARIDAAVAADIADEDWNVFAECVRTLWKQCSPAAKKNAFVHRGGVTHPASELPSSQLMLVLAALDDSVADADLEERLVSIVQQSRLDMRSSQSPINTRVRAARLLGSRLISKLDQIDDLKQLLSIDQPGLIRAAALSAAYRVNEAETADLLLAAWPHFLPDERRIAGATLLQRPSWTRKLVQAMLDEKLRVSDLDASTINALSNYEDYGVMKSFGTLITRPTRGERKTLIDRYVSEISLASERDIAAGERLYQENCRVCHESTGELAAIGPALANLKPWENVQWVTAILDPSANVEPKYLQYQAVTVSGQTFSGMVMNESSDSVQMGLADGRRIEIPRADIETMRASGVSLMPDAMETKLTPQQLADVIAWLQSR